MTFGAQTAGQLCQRETQQPAHPNEQDISNRPVSIFRDAGVNSR
jgi:hypothetical protein